LCFIFLALYAKQVLSIRQESSIESSGFPRPDIEQLKNANAAGRWWLKSVILATQEGGIRRMEV
jgi:hypothetical protein